jgi:hypothetical protein
MVLEFAVPVKNSSSFRASSIFQAGIRVNLTIELFAGIAETGIKKPLYPLRTVLRLTLTLTL